MGEKKEKLYRKTLLSNRYLRTDTLCYSVLPYRGFGHPDNPEFLLTLKNTFNEKNRNDLLDAKKRVTEMLVRWIPVVMWRTGMQPCTMVCIPRAKEFRSYTREQMFLLDGVSEAAQKIPNVEDGTGAIVRTVSTKTTHLRKPVDRVTVSGEREPNTGSDPYPGITKETCHINTRIIRGKNIILIDDIYTETINIDEDCIQALYDSGAANVVLFTLAYTKRESSERKENPQP